MGNDVGSQGHRKLGKIELDVTVMDTLPTLDRGALEFA